MSVTSLFTSTCRVAESTYLEDPGLQRLEVFARVSSNRLLEAIAVGTNLGVEDVGSEQGSRANDAVMCRAGSP
jgi:hypothetical protein